jgi:hypothetical protein
MTQIGFAWPCPTQKDLEKMPARIVIDGAKFNRGGADQPQ